MPVDLTIVSTGFDSTGNMDAVRGQLANPVNADNVQMMIQEMLARCGRQAHSIRNVRIWGHGAPGYMFIGTGDSRPQAEINKFGFNETSLTFFNRATLEQLRGYFASNGSITMHGCRVASGRIGQLFLEKLAMLWQVSVAAGMDDQLVEHGGNMPLFSLHGRIRQVLFNQPVHSPVNGVNRGFEDNDPRRRFSISYSAVRDTPETPLQQ